MSARKEHDDRLFEQLYRRHRSAVYGSLLRDLRSHDEAEEATQVTFLQAYGAVRRGGRPERPRAWLLAIADNLRRRRFVRAQGRPREVQLEDADELPARETEGVEDVRDALTTLPVNQRAAFVLREVGGLSYVEIARQLGVTVQAVQMLLFRARNALRRELEETTRRASSWLPGWLATLLGQGDRLAPAVRVGGATVVAAVASTVALGGAAPAPPPAIAADERETDVSRPVGIGKIQAPKRTETSQSVERRARRARQRPRAGEIETAPANVRAVVPTPEQTVGPGEADPALRLPVPPALPPAPEVSVPEPPALPLPALPVPAPVPVPLPVEPAPALPLP